MQIRIIPRPWTQMNVKQTVVVMWLSFNLKFLRYLNWIALHRICSICQHPLHMPTHTISWASLCMQTNAGKQISLYFQKCKLDIQVGSCNQSCFFTACESSRRQWPSFFTLLCTVYFYMSIWRGFNFRPQKHTVCYPQQCRYSTGRVTTTADMYWGNVHMDSGSIM